MKCKVDGPYTMPLVKGNEDYYILRVIDSDNGSEIMCGTWTGNKIDAMRVVHRMASVYEQGIKDGEQKALNRVIDMVAQLAGVKV